MTNAVETSVEQLIDKFGIPSLLRAITAVCRRRYDQLSMRAWKRRSRKNDFFSELSRRERKERDTTSAWLYVDLEHDAKRFEERIKNAGESQAEHHARCRAEEIQQTESKLAQLKQGFPLMPKSIPPPSQIAAPKRNAK